MNDTSLVDDLMVREWMLCLLGKEQKPFTPEVNSAMQEIWKDREHAVGERKVIVDVFEAVLEYRATEERFTPYYSEKQDRLKILWNKILERARALKEYLK